MTGLVAVAMLLAFTAVAGPPVLAASCNGASHTMVIDQGRASPGSGPVGTSFIFAVRYTDNAGCAPSVISVSVAGVGTYPLAFTGGDPLAGARYAVVLALPVGTWSYTFHAESGTGPGARTADITAPLPSVVVVQPIVTPAPTPTATPKPTPTAPPKATPKPTPKATPKPAPTAAPTPRPTTAATPTAGPTIAPSAGPPSAGPSPTDPAPTATGTAGPASPSASRGPLVAGGPHPSGGLGGTARPGGGSPRDLEPGGGFDPLRPFRGPVGPAVLTWILIALAGIAATRLTLGTSTGGAAFGWLAGRGGTARRTAAQAGPSAPSSAPAAAPAAARAPAAVPEEAPTVIARPWAPVSRTRPPLRFAGPPRRGVDRRVVSYQMVRLSDGPDDLRTVELGRLDRGDEVEIIEAADGYVRVRTPEGLDGWVPGITVLRQWAGSDSA